MPTETQDAIARARAAIDSAPAYEPLSPCAAGGHAKRHRRGQDAPRRSRKLH